MQHRQHTTGFTLIEIMLAMGLLTVGMAMVAGLFPAAIAQSRRAVQINQSRMDCENMVAMVKMNLKPYHVAGLQPAANGWGRGWLPMQPDQARGYYWLIAAQQTPEGDYRIVLVRTELIEPGSPTSPADPPTFATVPAMAQLDADNWRRWEYSTYDQGQADLLAVGSLILNLDTNQYATILSVDPVDEQILLSNDMNLDTGSDLLVVPHHDADSGDPD